MAISFSGDLLPGRRAGTRVLPAEALCRIAVHRKLESSEDSLIHPPSKMAHVFNGAPKDAERSVGRGFSRDMSIAPSTRL